MRIETFDHVALWVRDPDAAAGFLTDHLGVRVIERVERFTLVGPDARRGKLTLFAADGERAPAPLARIGLRVNDLERAAARLPAALAVEREEGGVASFPGPEGLRLALVEAETAVDYDLDHVALAVRDVLAARRELLGLGFERVDGRLAAAGVFLDLVAGDPGDPERSLLNHLGLRVESAAEHLAEARARGLDVVDVVDAPNTIAVFVWGPERIKVEYVEHKPTFSLV